MMSDPPIHPTSTHWIIRFGSNAHNDHNLQPKSKTVPEFKAALQLIWAVLPEKATQNAVKEYAKRLQAFASAKLANTGYYEHIMC